MDGSQHGGRFFDVVYNHQGSTITGGTFNAVVANYSDNEITGTFNAGVIMGSGTENSPFRIFTAEGLKWLSKWVNTMYADACAVL